MLIVYDLEISGHFVDNFLIILLVINQVESIDIRKPSKLSVINLSNAKSLKDISKELMLVAWYPASWWNFCTPENDKKKWNNS